MPFDAIPQELRDLNQWVVWKTELVPGRPKPTKVPYQARKRGNVKASSTNPDTWTNYLSAVNRVEKAGDMDGIGFVFTLDDPYFGIDFDGITIGGAMDTARIVDAMDTYSEVSPSGTGVHVIGRGNIPSDRGRHPAGFGIFEHSRFFTMTGQPLEGKVRPIRNVQTVIDANWNEWFPEPVISPGIPVVPAPWFASDEDIIKKIRESAQSAKFDALFSGDLADYGGDHSAADLGLASIITFWTQDRDQILRLFSHSALGRREKWLKRPDYREMTVTKALQRTEFYTPPIANPTGMMVVRGKADDGTDREVVTFHTTDKGNALRVLYHYGHSIRYCHPLKAWYVWTGSRWQEDESGEVARICLAALAMIHDEAENVIGDDLRKALRKWAYQSEGAGRITVLPKIIQDFHELSISSHALDANPFLLNVQNGTINLATGQFRPHAREDYLTRLAPVAYDPDATCPTWDRFLDTVFAGNPDLIAFVQRALGYAITGDVTERAMFMLYGSGRNGKSTLVETIGRILGDYATTSSADLVSARKGDPAMPTDLARLLGIRFTAASETGESSRLDEARVKHITGSERIIGERKYRDPFEFDPQFKIWLSTNHTPNIRGNDDGIWDRVRLIPFAVRIPDDDVDRYLKDKLLAEASGILNWLVAGCLAWQDHGLGRDDAVSAATAEYRESMDSLGTFIREECVTDHLSSIPLSDLYTAYEKWSKDSGEYIISKRALANRLKDRGYTVTKEGKRHITTVTGIRLPFISESPGSTTDRRIAFPA